MPSFPDPQSGASLLLSHKPTSRHNTIILLAPGRITALRALSALEAGYQVVVGAHDESVWDAELAHRRDQGQVRAISWPLGADLDADESRWADWFDNVLPREVSRACINIALNDTISQGSVHSSRRSWASARAFARVAADRRFLVNIADAPGLSDFNWPTTHRFSLDSSHARSVKSPLQLAITTNSSACRLAARLRREIVASLPTNIGQAVLAVSNLRTELRKQALGAGTSNGPGMDAWSGNDEDTELAAELASTGLNRPVEQLTREKSEQLEQDNINVEPSFKLCSARLRGSNGRAAAASELEVAASSVATSSSSSWTAVEAQRTRMRYVAQLSEYWPLDRLATVNLATLSGPSTPLAPGTPGTRTPPAAGSPDWTGSLSSHHNLAIVPPVATDAQRGRIFLLGTGPGSTLLLTRLAYLFLTSPPGSPYYVDVFLSDKLVPAEILALIPAERRAGVVIAKKYPGNAEHAQDELMRLAVEGAQAGKTVLRMKQGDPFLYGRGGEEVLHFRQAGFEPVVIPGLSSCLAGPTIAGIPVTQRGVAESLSVCTGVGRGGRSVAIDGYERGKTLTVLMGVARLDALVDSLIRHPHAPYPPYLPIALIERASSPDQRVVSATIETLARVLAQLSPHRPPGMIVVGWAVMCLDGRGDMRVLDEAELGTERDQTRVREWLGEPGYRVREGLGEGWKGLAQAVGANGRVEELVVDGKGQTGQVTEL